jgi:lysophospholipase L1-like esterase
VRSWTASWASAVAEPAPAWADGDWGYLTAGFADQTLRHIVHTSAGGEAVRVTLSNYFGVSPVRVDAATVAVSAQAAGTAAVTADSHNALTFGGRPGVTVPPGQLVTSDATELAVPSNRDLAVDLYFPAATGPPNGHLWATRTSHVGPGDLTGDVTGARFTVGTTSSYFLTAVDVLSDSADGSVVVLGDSLSDGILTIAPDTDQKWSDRVFDRLAAGGPPRLGVVNVAVAGNALHPISDPDSALARFDRDVLARSGLTTVIVLLGTNDIGANRAPERIVDGLAQLIDRAHAAGVRVVGATIPPIAGPADGACQVTDPADPVWERKRQAANARIRPGSPESLGFDAVVDFDAVLRSPADHSRIRCAFAGFGNNFHPNSAGHRAMGDAVDLTALK